jgi:hypothetical protein
MRLAHLAVAAAVLLSAPPLTRAHEHAPVRSGPYTLELVDESGAPLPTFEHRGRSYVLGSPGGRYLVKVRNESARRAEVVVSVDGRDVLDGRSARTEKRGYVVAPWGEVVVDGFRLSDASVAAFRFSSVSGSYAAQMGDARDVGVIGVAVFPERAPRPRPPRPVVPYGDRAETSRAPSAPGDAAPAPSAPEAERHAKSGAAPEERPGLGTAFGEEHESHVTSVAFQRESSRPAAVLTLRYDDRPGLVALGIDVDRRYARRDDDARLRESADPFRRSRYAEPPPGWMRH